ncbi:MAG: hypothetical protein FRX48_03587 [Lasallia pustulata]|uniref:Uncharacterized protein n=1 Tax=Lasallia pustulata TaxID=136370 RepID=A0A5M8PSP6_9LECA|nr:MAG: hypothetical protein FRX48_03587 [Lasallia pustulata]
MSSGTKSDSDGMGCLSTPLDGSQPKRPLQISSYLKEKDRYKAFLCEQQKITFAEGHAMTDSLLTWEEDWARRSPNEPKHKKKPKL